MKFKVVTAVAIIVLGAPLWTGHLSLLPWWALLLLCWSYVSIIVWGCVTISSGFFLPILWHGNRAEKAVALTFDDGPHPVYTARILDMLDKYGVPATFFCIGKNIEENESLLQRIKNEGHIIGNHSYSHHFWFDLWGSRKMLSDIRQMNNKVFQTTGLRPQLFRPPYGVINPNVKKAIIKGGYLPLGWSVRSLDTTAKDEQRLLTRIVGQVRGGDIILLHDSVEITTDILPRLIEEIHKKGFDIVPLDKMLNINAYA